MAQVAATICTLLFVSASFLVSSPTTLIIFLTTAGLFMIAPVVVMLPLVGDLFGVKSLGTIMGIAMFIQGIITAIGPMVTGMIADATGAYNMAFALYAVFYIVGFTAITLIRPTRLGIPAK